MRKLIFSLMVLFCVSTMAGQGHSHGHSHGAVADAKSANEISAMAIIKLADLVKIGKVDKSWDGKAIKKVFQKSFSKGPEWVVTFENTQLPDKNKQTLYMFYTLKGTYLASNYSGN